MNNWKRAITLATCCCIVLTMAASASADYFGVTAVTRDDPDTEFLCTQGHGDFVPGPLTICNVFVAFDEPSDRLLAVGNADLQVYNGAKPNVFFQHPENSSVIAPACALVATFPDALCDTFITIGHKCGPDPPGFGNPIPDGDFDHGAFNNSGHVVGGWINSEPPSGQGDAGNYPDLEVLFLQSSVAQGLSLSGDIDIIWLDQGSGDTIVEVDVPIECVASCISGEACDDGDPCTVNDTCSENGECVGGLPIDCDDDNACTDDGCDPDMGCTHVEVECSEGQLCDPETGACVEEQDPCECENGRVTLCHVPPGNLGKARTITVGCAARDKHLAHGDVCGPCEDGGG